MRAIPARSETTGSQPRTPKARVAAHRAARQGEIARAQVGKNIGWGTGSFCSPRGMVRQWMRSPGHRANILNPRARDAGVGIALGTPGGHGGATYTLDLGRSR